MNLYDYSVPESGERFTSLLKHEKVRIERIVSSDDLEPKTYRQKEDEWVVLLQGEARLEIDGEERQMQKGDTLFIPASTPHRVLKTTQGTLWLAIHIR